MMKVMEDSELDLVNIMVEEGKRVRRSVQLIHYYYLDHDQVNDSRGPF